MTSRLSEKHDPTCRLCAILAEGRTVTKNGVSITPLCRRCATHHSAGACAVNIEKGICPSCRKNRRVLVSDPSVGRSERKRYGAYCAACYWDAGYRPITVGDYLWYEPKPVVDDVSDKELFASLNPNFPYADRVRS